MKKLLTLLLLLSIQNTTNAQSWQWAKQNTSGCMIDVGDPWDFAVTNPVIATDAFGNVYMLGTYISYDITFGTFTIHRHGFSDGFLVKYDSLGNVKWLKGFNGISPASLPSPYINTNAIVTDPNGNIYISGNVYDTGVVFGADTIHYYTDPDYFYNGFLFKIDSNGNNLWAKNTAVNAITTDTKGNLYVISHGYFNDSVVLGTITLHAIDSFSRYFAKYDSLGTMVWAKVIGDYGLTAITTDTFDNIIIAGSTIRNEVHFDTTTLPMIGTEGHFHIFYAKYNTAGNLLWAKSAGGNSSVGIYSNSITIDKSGNIYMIGNTDSINTISFDAYSFIASHWFLIKLNEFGVGVWFKNSNDSISVASNITRDAQSNIYIAGNFRRQAIIGLDTLTSSDDSGYIFIKIDTSGNAMRLNTINRMWWYYFGITFIAASPIGNVFTTGTYTNNGVINIGTTTLYNPETTWINIFIAKIDEFIPLITTLDTVTNNNFFIYPNPNSGVFTIDVPPFNNKILITISDITGKIIETRTIQNKISVKEQFNITGRASGEYIVTENIEGVKKSVKIILK